MKLGRTDYILSNVENEFHIPQSNFSEFMKHKQKAFFYNRLTPDQTFSNVPLSLGVNTTTFYYDANAYETVQQKAANLLNYSAMIASGVAPAAGISASIVQSQAAPMFVSSTQLQVNTISFTNFNYIYLAGSGSDGPMTISLYQSSSQESMVINGQEYNFNVQSPYVYAADV